ncbi:hypothetical protein RB596_006006 [Gaeumannomyces avenae]
MAATQLPSIDGQLVTLENPPRLGLDGMDHARCAALHNYLVDYRLQAAPDDGQPNGAADEGGRATYFSTWGEAAEAVRPRLHPSLAAFFAAARMPRRPFHFFADDFPEPRDGAGGLFYNEVADLVDMPPDLLVWLFDSNSDSGGESQGGLLYHQGLHKCAFLMHLDDYGSAFPPDEHPHQWHPLETVLSHWIHLLQIAKVVASPSEQSLYGSDKVGPWEWRPYSEAQLTSCVAAWDRLCAAIEARLPGFVPGDAPREPLLAPDAFDAASIPDPSFARSFLGSARRPRHIRSIAPGILLPPADATAFAAAQPFTHLPRRVPQAYGPERQGIVPPVYILFSEAGAPQVDIKDWKSLFRYYWDDGQRNVPNGIAFPSYVPAGVYTNCLVRSDLEATEEAFRFLLPFNLEGARLSCGHEIRDANMDQLFQHGYKPFGGDTHRPQRLQRLLEHWTDLVDRRVWNVGPLGVQGSLEVFKDATVNSVDYTIPPSW